MILGVEVAARIAKPYMKAKRAHRHVKIVLRNGKTLEHASNFRDQHEMNMDGVERKFRQCYSLYPRGKAADADRIIEEVAAFAGLSCVKDVFRRWCSGPGAQQ